MLPCWVAVGGATDVGISAGMLSVPVMFCIIGGYYEIFQSLFELFYFFKQKTAYDMANYQVGVHMHAFFGENSKAIAEWYYPFYAAQMNRVGASRGWPPYQRSQYDFGRSKHAHLLVGEANEMIDKILEIQESFGLTRFAAHMDVGSPDHAQMMKSIEIYGTQIVPKVKAALAK